MLKKGAILFLFVWGLLALVSSPCVAALPSVQDYQRIVVLGDPHYPTRPQNTDAALSLELVEAKQNAVDEINSWDDVALVVVVGDIVAAQGTEEEYAEARGFIERIKKPVAVIPGNHDLIYRDEPNVKGKLQRAAAKEREMKVERFKTAYGLEEVYYSKKVGDYLLLFLAPDRADSKYLCEISEEQLAWLKKTLAENAALPTLIFFHAPLAGTLADYNKEVNTVNFIAQPKAKLDAIIESNPQIVAWVSGHTHTPASNPSFAAPLNLYQNRVWNIHNADLDRKTIWTNSLYLYPEQVVVKTYNHKTGQFIDADQRIIKAKP
ncbi:metallophosphoesterase family protein [Azotosporobacter soli]|uniref:metallophosphoesterase family protein n=1 Tax=Azotosporobacter soli TaxID=3055040 RepID=UPI0031FF4106